ncbi:hypothetical protein L9F63_009449 [Diploptera punctata]|uniref:Astakine n=1 Tax=Diploptera punctata TaxID=6984 RepID=A0AAD8AJE2_DIPPU|nr:hypothetical protein L9F63_009449 [Diploptera punctata]
MITRLQQTSPILSIMFAVIILLSSAALVQAEVSRPSYFECLDSDECDTSQCCLLSQQRYSIPACRQLGDVGSSCRPNNKPRDFDVIYPDGYNAIIKNAYLNICNCQHGLECNRKTGTCQRVHN